jgi:hypothetical protein
MNARAGLKIAAAGLLLSAAAGCSTRYLRDAQDRFNAAAQSEARLAADEAQVFSTTPAAAYSPALADYRIADMLINRELAQNRSELKQDNLLGNAYALKAMTLWRLADLELEPEASRRQRELAGLVDETARQASSGEVSLASRDRVVIAMVPGLVDHDRGLRATTLPEASRRFRSAFAVVGDATRDVPLEHDVVSYARASQLQTLKAWNAALTGSAEFANPTEKAACQEKIIVARLRQLPISGAQTQAATALRKFRVASLSQMGISQCRVDANCPGGTAAAPNQRLCPLPDDVS